jgi:hypothetical protein
MGSRSKKKIIIIKIITNSKMERKLIKGKEEFALNIYYFIVIPLFFLSKQ